MSESAASSAATTAAPATPTVGRSPSAEHAEAVRRLRNFSLAQVLLLAVQTGLGLVANIFATLPAADQGKGLLSSFVERGMTVSYYLRRRTMNCCVRLLLRVL